MYHSFATKAATVYGTWRVCNIKFNNSLEIEQYILQLTFRNNSNNNNNQNNSDNSTNNQFQFHIFPPHFFTYLINQSILDWHHV
jgi:DNA replication protein DnaD